jgi:hypothetical protein
MPNALTVIARPARIDCCMQLTAQHGQVGWGPDSVRVIDG